MIAEIENRHSAANKIEKKIMIANKKGNRK